MGRQNWSSPPTVYAPGTNMQVVFGNSNKIQRNVKRVTGLFTLNARPMQSGEKFQETLSDPLHRPGADIMQIARTNASIAGPSRAHIRPAAPQQVSWKNSYTLAAKTAAPIGPLDQQISKSILQRISSGLSMFGGGTS